MYSSELVQAITEGNCAVMSTDTIYGIVCSAQNRDAVEELYRIKKRNTAKPFIILIAEIEQLKLFDIDMSKYESVFQQYWPGPVSVILPCTNDRFSYLHRGSQTLAFRLPAKESVRELLRKTGPLVAPSANPEGLPPAATINEAKQYFGDAISYYEDGGEIHGTPSTIISIGEDGSITKLR